jgi:hypothetical protein
MFLIINTSLIGIFFQSFSAVILLLLLNLAIFKHLKKKSIDAILLFNIGVLFAVFLLWYWEYFYGSSYYLGKMSDDWQYDVYWSQGYFETYGISPLYLVEHLNKLERGLGLLHNSKGYVYIVTLFYGFGSVFDGYHTLLPRIFNIYLLVLIAIYTQKIFLEYSVNLKVSRKLLYFVFLYPVLLFISSHVFRDTLVGLLVILIVFYSIRLKTSKISVLFILLFMLSLLTLRTGAFLMMMLVIPIITLDKKLIYTFFPFIILPTLIAILYFKSGYLLDYTERSLSTYDALNSERMGGIGQKIFDLPKYLGIIPRTVYLLFTPVPSFINFHQFFISLSAVVKVLFFPFLLGSLLSPKIESKIKMIFLLLFYGVALSTATFRHVTMFLPLGMLLVALSVDKKLFPFLSNQYLLYMLVLSFFVLISIVLIR